MELFSASDAGLSDGDLDAYSSFPPLFRGLHHEILKMELLTLLQILVSELKVNNTAPRLALFKGNLEDTEVKVTFPALQKLICCL